MIKRDFPTFVLYSLGFLLLWEWLRPIGQLTDTEHMNIFLLFAFLCFLISYFQIRMYGKFLIKIIYIIFFLNVYFYKDHFLGFFKDISKNMTFLFDSRWDYISNSFRTFIFFLLLWLMIYFICDWLLKRRRFFLFFIMTVTYICVLDSFTPYSGNAAIVRTILFGLTAMGMQAFYRMVEREKVKWQTNFFRKWMIPLAAMIILSFIIGLTAPKAAPIWPDPVPYFQSMGHGTKGEGTRKNNRSIGYSEDDSSLGGPFKGNNHVVFRIVAGRENYWKVETKDTYTGKGWVASGTNFVHLDPLDLVPVFSIPNSISKTYDYASILSETKDNYFIYPAGIQRFHLPGLSGEDIEMNGNEEKISSFGKGGKPLPIKNYQISYAIPNYNYTDLEKTTDESGIGSDFLHLYTSLPESLPPRVKQLAEKITAGKMTWFDKAKAVEEYLNGPDFTYDQKKVALPGKKDDYVDQFLFETKRGYCDNFSSAMAVMLRTIGIPTRWIKGFNGGKRINQTVGENAEQVYSITNNDAHSWVEVFYPNQGWVPFEPTKGFVSDVDIRYPSASLQTSTNTKQTPSAPVIKKPEKPLYEEKDPQTIKKQVKEKTKWQKTESFLKQNKTPLLLYIVVLGVAAVFLYWKRRRWIPFYLLLHYSFRKEDKYFEKAYLSLLKQLERYGVKRKGNQTLRNYANYIDEFFSTNEMTKLTSLYEQHLYHQVQVDGSWTQAHELWENLIKKTIA